MVQFWRKCAAVGFLAFVALWVAGVVVGSALPFPQPVGLPLYVSEEPSGRLSNWANNLGQLGLAETPLPIVLDQGNLDRIQVYEKSAHLGVGSETFDADESRIRSALAGHKAVIFNEKNGGITPGRRLSLEVGVHPDQFDALVDKLRAIGQLLSVNAQQRDRTGELRRLHAQRQSLKKYLESVLKLRDGKSLKFDESLRLEQKIQDIEKELEGLSVQLGDFLGKESFYHVYLTLVEYQSGGRIDQTYTFPRRVAHALPWALARWCALVLGVGILVGTYISIKTLWPAWMNVSLIRRRI